MEGLEEIAGNPFHIWNTFAYGKLEKGLEKDLDRCADSRGPKRRACCGAEDTEPYRTALASTMVETLPSAPVCRWIKRRKYDILLKRYWIFPVNVRCAPPH